MGLIKHYDKGDIVAEAMQKAIKSGSDKDMQEAWKLFRQSIADEITDNMLMLNGNNDISNKIKGHKIKKLSPEAKQYYESVGNKLKAKQSAITPNDIVMPQTEVDRVTDNMITSSLLLDKITFIPGGEKYLTKYVTNAKGVQKGIWGTVTSEVAQELLQRFKVIDITQQKLSCYGQISIDMLELGPTFLANHINATLIEGTTVSLEEGIINGTGNKQPIGLTRDLKGTVQDGVYPLKTKVKVSDLTPKTYGSLIKQISFDENGRAKRFDKVTLIVNRNTYLDKILPATTIIDPLSNIGYKINVFPYPTDVIIVSEGLQDNEAILCILEEYLLCSGKAPTITYSDEYKFLEDLRVYKCRCFFDGRPVDNNTSVFLDLSELDELIPKVKTISESQASNSESQASN